MDVHTLHSIPVLSIIPTAPGVAFGEVWSRGICMRKGWLNPLSLRFVSAILTAWQTFLVHTNRYAIISVRYL